MNASAKATVGMSERRRISLTSYSFNEPERAERVEQPDETEDDPDDLQRGALNELARDEPDQVEHERHD